MEIRLERRLPHPPARVWRALTDPAALAQWLMPNDFKPVLGHRFQFRFKPMPGWRGYVECAVIELDEPRLLAYTWLGDDDWTAPTVVRWRLDPVAEGTRLTLEHTGFQEPWGGHIVDMLRGGWGSMLNDRLPSLLERLERGVTR